MLKLTSSFSKSALIVLLSLLVTQMALAQTAPLVGELEVANAPAVADSKLPAEEDKNKKQVEFVIGGGPGANVSVKIADKEVSPAEVELAPGTTVVWVNRTENVVQVRFIDGAVSTTCKAPLKFEIGSEGVYKSQLLSGGDVASLCFLESQEYPYEILIPSATAQNDDSNNSDSAAKVSSNAHSLKGIIKVR